MVAVAPRMVHLRLQPPADEDLREALMSIKEVYEKWEREVLERGREQGRELALQRSLVSVFARRFVPLPDEWRACVESLHDLDVLPGLVVEVAVCDQAGAEAALRACGG